MQPFYSHNNGQIVLYQGDCLDVMPWLIEQGVKVDATISDIPYGTTACSWDIVIPFDAMWKNIKGLNKPKAATVLFGSQPFTSLLIASNIKEFKCEWIWDKVLPTGYLDANKKPMKRHENIIVFSDGQSTYNPEMRKGKMRTKGGMKNPSTVYGTYNSTESRNDENYYPTSIIEFSNADRTGRIHPTQKNLQLMQYLIRTYTNPGDTVLDFTSGSGTTLHAALGEGRRAIGIERDLDDKGNCLGYCEYTRQRLTGERVSTVTIDGVQVQQVQGAMQLY